MDRRQFMMLSAAALATAGCARPMNLVAARSRRPWGLQLFTVIAPLEKDFEGTLRTVAEIGYREVETIGSFGRDPAYVRSLLDKYGLVSPSHHIASKAVYDSFAAWTRREITTDQNRVNYVNAFQLDHAPSLIEEAIVTAKALGQRYVIWPILMPQHLASRNILDAYLRLFNEAGAACAREGLTFAFHNHDREFARLGNDLIYDLILAETDPDKVKMELDFYWISKAGFDPVVYLKRHAGRFRLCHIKDMTANRDFAVVGSGVLDLPMLINAAADAGVSHFFVEYDRSDDPIAAVRAAYSYLNALPR